MAIAVRSSGSTTWDILGTSRSVSRPAGTQDGDLMVVSLSFGWSSGGPFTSSAPAGWTAVGENVGGSGASNTQRCSVYYRVAQPGDASWTFTQSGANWFGGALQTFSGVDPATPIDATGTASTNSGSATISANAVTVATANAWELIGTCAFTGPSNSATGFTTLGNAGGESYAALLYNTTPLSTGSTGAVTVTNSLGASGQTLAAIPFAIRPDTSVRAAAAVTLGPLSPSASGRYTASGSAAKTLGSLAISGSAFAGCFGSAGIALGGLSAASSGTCVLFAHAGITLGNTAAAASGFFRNVAHAGVTLGGTVAVAHAAMTSIGSAAVGLRGIFPLAGNQPVYYLIYQSDAAGQPIDYDHPAGSTGLLSWTSGNLSPGTWMFGVRAADAAGIELNLACSTTVIVSATGADVTNMPVAPAGLRGHAIAGGSVVVEWAAGTNSVAAKNPAGFRVYKGTGGAVDYGTVSATVAANTSIGGAYQTTLSGLTDGTTYSIGVRAYNATGEETNTTTISVTADASGPLPVTGLSGAAVV
jgi:hypothetical protein